MSRWLWRLHTLLKGAGRGLPGRIRTCWTGRGRWTPPRAPTRPAERPETPRRRSSIARRSWPVTARRGPDARPLRRLGPRHPRVCAAGAPRRAGGGPRPRHRHPQRLRALRHRTTRAPCRPTPRTGSRQTVSGSPASRPGHAAGDPWPARRALAREAAQWVAEVETPPPRGRTSPCMSRRRAELELIGRAAGPFMAHRQGRPHRDARPDGFAHLLDYKTGERARAEAGRTAGFSPQLTLTAAILAMAASRGSGPRRRASCFAASGHDRALRRREAGRASSAPHP